MENKHRILPNVASFLVSEDCNLACTYCFEIEGREECNKDMTKEVARKTLDFLSDNAVKDGVPEFSAMIFGGEPFMNPDVVEEIFRYGVKLGREKNLRFTTSIVTNATILTDKIKLMITKYMYTANINLQLSVDGIKEIHDKYRVTKNGKGSFDMIAKNIDEWKELFEDNIHALSIHGCSNHETLPYLFENYKFFREEWNVPRLWFLPIHSEVWQEGDVEIYEEQLGKILDYTLECAKRDGNYQEVLNYAPLDRCFNPDVRPNAPCGAGKNFVTVTAEGEIYPCHSFYYNDPEKTTKIGDVFTGIDEQSREIYIDFTNEDMSCAKECPDCDAYHCYRCIADNWVENGSILSQIRGYRCEMSFVERKLQLKAREELTKMGLLNKNLDSNTDTSEGNNPLNPDCLCDVRTYNNFEGNNQIRDNKEHVCQCGDKEKDNETLALALKTLLEKVSSLEEGQNLILKRLLK